VYFLHPHDPQVHQCHLRVRSLSVLFWLSERVMPADESNEVSLSERDLRALAMELALQLPRCISDAERVLDLMRAGYDYFLCEYKPPKEAGAVVRPKFRRRGGG
jgi:hypothetical protein